MFKLRKILDDSSKARRHRRINLNIQITFLSWIMEVLGFFFPFLGLFVLGHGNVLVNHLLQTITALFYFAIVPSMYLINSSDFKAYIVDSQFYLNLDKLLNPKSPQSATDEEVDEGDDQDG